MTLYTKWGNYLNYLVIAIGLMGLFQSRRYFI